MSTTIASLWIFLVSLLIRETDTFRVPPKDLSQVEHAFAMQSFTIRARADRIPSVGNSRHILSAVLLALLAALFAVAILPVFGKKCVILINTCQV